MPVFERVKLVHLYKVPLIPAANFHPVVLFASVTGSRMWRKPIRQQSVTGRFPALDQTDNQLFVSVVSLCSYVYN